MDAKEAAALLNGREYRKEITREEEAALKAAGLVAVFGASDDLVEFRGAIHDEAGAHDGGSVAISSTGLPVNECDNDECPHFQKIIAAAQKIDAIWGEDDISWSYRTSIPHETFQIMEDGEVYCRGIVFALADVAKAGDVS